MSAAHVQRPVTGLVLSGGGMRGAYEVGVVRGIAEALGRRADGGPLFSVFTGTSVGAINAAYFAANAHRSDHDVAGLVDVWQGLTLGHHTQFRPLGFIRPPASLSKLFEKAPWRRSLLNAGPLDKTVSEAIAWQSLHDNVDRGLVRALVVPALHVATGRTTMFAELAPGVTFRASRDPRRIVRKTRIENRHVMASSAIPLLFPTRRVDDEHFCDGGLRFNTPIAPAIRAGASRLVVVSLMHQGAVDGTRYETPVGPEGPDLPLFFLIGKLLNALLLDPVAYDLQVLDRLNALMCVVEESVSAEDYEKIQRLLRKKRGAAYGDLETLVFMPSQDLGKLATEHFRSRERERDLSPFVRFALSKVESRDEADWASYVLFDGRLAEKLIDLGHRDTLEKRDEIREFFAEVGG